MAVVLPLTVPLDGITAIILLISIYSGAMYGGSIAAILINTPGNAAAAATTFDGYPMTRLGQARKALAVSATASALGGMLTIVTIILLSPLRVRPHVRIARVLHRHVRSRVDHGGDPRIDGQGITAGAFGLLLTSVGIPVMTFEQRYTFGILELQDGISFVVALIGVFAIGEMMRLAAEQGGIVKEDVELSGSIASGFWEVIKIPFRRSDRRLSGSESVPSPGPVHRSRTSSPTAKRSEAIATTPTAKEIQKASSRRRLPTTAPSRARSFRRSRSEFRVAVRRQFCSAAS